MTKLFAAAASSTKINIKENRGFLKIKHLKSAKNCSFTEKIENKSKFLDFKTVTVLKKFTTTLKM